jgi:hypothetical protein
MKWEDLPWDKIQELLVKLLEIVIIIIRTGVGAPALGLLPTGFVNRFSEEKAQDLLAQLKVAAANGDEQTVRRIARQVLPH